MMDRTVSVKIDMEKRTLTVVSTTDPDVEIGWVEPFEEDILAAIRRLHKRRIEDQCQKNTQ